MSLAECQAAVAARVSLPETETCGYDSTATAMNPLGDTAAPDDSEYAGAVMPAQLSTGGYACGSGSDRPVLDTVRPELFATFTAGPGPDLVYSTFQLTGLDHYTDQDRQIQGSRDDWGGRRASVDLRRYGSLEHGESYRWRVRATPPWVAAGGWSPWCEFTVAQVTPDDLGVDAGRDYTVTLPVQTWRMVLAVLGPVQRYVNGGYSTHAPIRDAVKRASAATGEIPVTASGPAWVSIVERLCSTASQNHAPETWELADAVSRELGGPEHPTLGFPRD